ncbi:MAG: hypothetical protein H6923_06030 [Alphaproteobacteria bacterium]|nr:hypothetical protein [Alphaproteobacteria bacterium]
MLFHASIPADRPEHVAKVVAELWRGDYSAFPPFPGSFIAFAGDARGSEIEVVPRGQRLVPDGAEVGWRNEAPSPASEVHLAVASPLTAGEILALARREGWTARVCDRGGVFHVVEFWIENKFLLEVLTEEFQAEYLAFMDPARFRALFGLAT